MARLTPKFERHGYLIGEINLLSASTPYQPLKTMYIKNGKVTLDQAPEGAGFTTFKLIRNFDPDDVLYTATFEAGETSKDLVGEVSLSAGDSMNLIVTSLTATFGGADLIFSLEYHN